ncbi:DgyrCDS4459 [Dimorphilus gyrociliatus]|uniref:DgyrCDS4459 n=1 Tax=Dimorphilus gyrociliatus TaxID=2664684 RepID=A0A7I8VLP1_9ANNE|nr:DgyrCDS4459 [Dimorphilus gyrociliatus]
MGCNYCKENSNREEDNLVQMLKKGKKIHVVDFLRIWMHYDIDRSGYIEGDELQQFASDLIRKKDDKQNSPEAVQAATRLFLKMFDTNRDKKIELYEFAQIIFTDTSSTPFEIREKLGREEFDQVFTKYDKVGSRIRIGV